MKLAIFLWLSTPITWLIVMMLVAAWSRLFHREKRIGNRPASVVRLGTSSSEAVAGMALFLSVAYRPNHAFMAKTQVQQHEDADDDEQGGPDTPRRHFLRQLRQIRRGEALDRLVLRLE